MNDKERIGTEIASLRTKRHMSIRKLAEESGIHFSNLSKIEKGKISAGIDTLCKIADALGAKIKIQENNDFLQ